MGLHPYRSVRHHPQAGGLMSGAASKAVTCLVEASRSSAPWFTQSKGSACSIRGFLFADVLADLLQLKSDRGHGVSTGPEMLAREIPLFAAQSGHRNSALPLEESDHRSHRMLGGNCDAHMHVVQQQMPFVNLALFLPGQRVENRPEVRTEFRKQHLPPPLGDKHHMVFAVPLRMG